MEMIVKEGDEIRIGNNDDPIKIRAIVSQVYENDYPADIEAVYLDEANKAINEDFVFKDGFWEFKNSGPCGGYADSYTRLKHIVSILRRKRNLG